MNSKKNVIYGTGDYGRRLYNLLSRNNIVVDYFCRSEVEETNELLLGVPIISISQLCNEEINCILIAIRNQNDSNLVKSQLQNILPYEISIFECGNFISDNISNGSKKCILCGNNVEDFLMGGRAYHIFEELHIIGGGVRNNCICPICNSRDRERWCMDVIKSHTNILSSSCRVLHFAPEKGIEKRIKANSRADYYCGDISEKKTYNKVNVMNMCQFQNQTFDYIIINHVLEHVIDLEIAVSELKRVLKEDGKIIMSFPICTNKKTIEQKEEMTVEEKIKQFGQSDHVRLFGCDYKEVIESYGLIVKVLSPKDKYNEEQIEQYGFIKDDIILMCEKAK